MWHIFGGIRSTAVLKLLLHHIFFSHMQTQTNYGYILHTISLCISTPDMSHSQYHRVPLSSITIDTILLRDGLNRTPNVFNSPL